MRDLIYWSYAGHLSVLEVKNGKVIQHYDDTGKYHPNRRSQIETVAEKMGMDADILGNLIANARPMSDREVLQYTILGTCPRQRGRL